MKRPNAADRFVEATAARYGVASALARARMMRHEYPANRRPQWLTRAIAELEARAAWESYCASGRKPADIPERPDLVYGKQWRGWVDWISATEGKSK